MVELTCIRCGKTFTANPRPELQQTRYPSTCDECTADIAENWPRGIAASFGGNEQLRKWWNEVQNEKKAKQPKKNSR
jgi:DNA-directed RNA polymerase subunit RPC12/RpoP